MNCPIGCVSKMNQWAQTIRKPLLGGLVMLLCCLPLPSDAQSPRSTAELGELQGDVFTSDPDGVRLGVAGASVKLSGNAASAQTSTDENGRYHFSGVGPGSYRIDVTAQGLAGSADVTVSDGKTTEAPVQLQVQTLQQSVTVTAEQSSLSSEPADQTQVTRSVVLDAPNRFDRFDSLLPLIPGVVRGPDGLINMKGARASQGGALLNSANVTDPATGNPALNLPIDVVETVSVIANPYDPEYGRLAGAVSNVDTTTGNFNDWHFSVQNLFPRPRKRNGDFVGLESLTPRMTVTGPLLKNKIAFTQSFEYRFIRVPVSSLPPLERDTRYEGFNSFTQIDATLSERQSLTASLALYPQKTNYLGLNTFTPQPSTSDLHQRGDMASLEHRYSTGAESLLVSQFSYKTYDADVTANSSAPYELFIETTTGGVFDRQRRNTSRAEWQETYHFATKHFLGTHQIKVGTDFAHSSYDGRVQLLPVTIFGVLEQPIEQIEFGSASRFGIHQNEMAWFVADTWSPIHRLNVELGVRVDHDSITKSTNAAPRAGFSLLLTQDGNTLLKGGIGLFYDRVPLNVVSFPFLPGRTVLDLDGAGETVESTSYLNTINGHVQNPRSLGWNVELDRQITSALTIRTGFEQRDTIRDFVLNPEQTLGVLSLSNAGSSFYREFQVSGRYKFLQNTVNASYVRSKAYGNLNDFNQFFGNNANPVIESDEKARLPFDAPNRFLFWGQFEAPLKLRLMPVFDVHTGFPYSSVDQYREFVGPRDSQRFPRFNSFDIQVTRPVSLPFPHKDMKARVGVSVFNLFNHFNPRDVQNDVDSDRSGALFNSVGRTFRGKFVLEF
ncbi:MAG: TonB-dependent receptor [Acidobacteriaceae bacterium]|nr:TonB-dependent receptor [Acidobacteriaceae bacterium]